MSESKQSDQQSNHSENIQPEEAETEFNQSSGLQKWLFQQNVSLLFSSYQSGILYSLGLNPNGSLHLHQAGIPRPMGIAYQGDGKLTLAAESAIISFENILTTEQRINQLFDACFVPRRMHITGHLDSHDVGITADGEVIFVNTRFNCLATLAARHSFTPVWKPDFISKIIDEDRCHLNGLAMKDGQPAYVTAISRSNAIDGWRDRRSDGGVIIDVQTNKIVCEGLSMPHSPRWFKGELWVLNSGTGEVGVAAGLNESGKMGKFEPRFFCPGFLRGLSFAGSYAIVGLSKPRYKRFEGLKLEQRLKDSDTSPWCGVQILDISKGNCAEWFNIEGSVSELYDLETIPDVQVPMIMAPSSTELSDLITFETE